MEKREYFTSRWFLLATILGMAIGTGNIWRFPRIVAQNGGGAFLIPWIIFLFTWSIPLLIIEFALGKGTRLGLLGAFRKFMGERFVFLGGFVAFVTTAIMFYYSVVTGWCLRYFLLSLTGGLEGLNHTGAVALFHQVSTSWSAVIFHVVAMSLTVLIVVRGLSGGIERANIVLIPSLFIILVISAIRGLTLPGGLEGLEFLFNPDWERLLDHRVWLEALSQSAWSTGAGWGLVLTYAVYLRQKDDIVLNSFLTGFGNNSASLLSGIVIFSAVFALVPAGMTPQEILQTSGRASTGLTFEWLPVLFDTMPGRTILEPLFFLGLSFAAISSLISMVELVTRILMDFGFSRLFAALCVWVGGILLGIPSALSDNFFNNQDWVWGLGLMVSGCIFAFSVIKFGVSRFRQEFITQLPGDFKLTGWFDMVVKYLIPIQFVLLMVWWFYKSLQWNPEWYNPFHTYSIGTCIIQWLLVGLILFLLSGFLSRRLRS